MSARSQSSAQGRRPDSVASAMSSYSDASSYTSSARAASRSYVQGYGQAGATQDWPESLRPGGGGGGSAAAGLSRQGSAAGSSTGSRRRGKRTVHWDTSSQLSRPTTSSSVSTATMMTQKVLAPHRPPHGELDHGAPPDAGGLPGPWRQPRVAYMKPRVHVIPEEAMAGAITDGVPGAPGPWRPPRSEYQHPAESSFDPDLATAAPPLHDDGPMPGPWRPPRSGPEVPAKARPADVSAGVKPGNEIATKVAGRNRSNHRALGDHQPQKNDVQFSTTFKEPDEAKWRPTKKGPAADGTGKIGVTSGGLYATTTQMPQPRRKMRSLGMSTVGLTDYPEWQTSTITWVPKEHQRTRDVSDDQLAEQLAVASDSAGSKPGSARPASTASQSNPPGTKLVKTRRQKPRSLGHTAPFLPIKNQEGVFGSSYDMTSSDLKVDKVPVPDQPLQDLFTGEAHRRTEKDDYLGRTAPKPERVPGQPAIKLFNGPMDGRSETKAQHPGYVKPKATAATRPQSSLDRVIAPEAIRLFTPETRKAHAPEQGGWSESTHGPVVVQPPTDDQFVTTNKSVYDTTRTNPDT